MRERIIELLYHPDPAMRLQGVELALATGETPLTVTHGGVAEAPMGIHGAMLRLLLEAPAELRAQVRTLYLALDDEAAVLIPLLPAALSNLEELHLLGPGHWDSMAPLDVAPLAALSKLKLLVRAGGLAQGLVVGLERLAGLESLTLYHRVLSWEDERPPDLRPLSRLRTLRLGSLHGAEKLDFLPEQIEALHLVDELKELWLAGLRGLSLRELTLPELPPALSPADLPSLQALNVESRDEPGLLRWPLRRLTLLDPADETLRALADQASLRSLAIKDVRGGAPGISFEKRLLSRLEQLSELDLWLHGLEEEHWPPRAVCSPSWLRLGFRRNERWTPPPAIRARSSARFWQEGRRLAVQAAGRRGSSLMARSALGFMWDLNVPEAWRFGKDAQTTGLTFVYPHEARTVQALMLGYERQAAIRPMTDAERELEWP